MQIKVKIPLILKRHMGLFLKKLLDREKTRAKKFADTEQFALPTKSPGEKGEFLEVVEGS